ncbi:MAG: 16S rRNA (guanine(527)-N(7))-methyltransferase RsmG [Clostridia bacterium]|nr:16S rRNA (guanine(527)-N(7))-methyltransferase RsmG [Clostridia bacterium]
MEYTTFAALLHAACEKNRLSIPTESQTRSFFRFTERLVEVNETTNLTAIREISDIICKHYVDSLLVSAYIPSGSTVLDLGCGPGFPSIPLAICRPDLSIAALDSTAKKIAFVQESAVLLELSNLNAVVGRAEDANTRKKLGSFDVVTSRAVARLNVLCELCLPYVKIGGTLVALKGAKAAEEAAEVTASVKMLGGEPPRIYEATLHTESGIEARGLVEIRKIAPTPPKYPRPYAAILKKPL